MPMAGPKGYVISFMMDVLAGVLTGSAFGDGVAGPYDPDRRSGAGHLLLTIDVAAVSDTAEFTARIEALVDQTRGGELAAWADEILVPGELEDRNRRRLSVDGIPLADTTRDALATLAREAGLAPATPLDAPAPTGPEVPA
jgi:LDH2 family malate/lactate/ureidoglycolate dehydrogenase